jgi:hypothetical protein
MTQNTIITLPANPAPGEQMRIVKGILWRDWLAHGQLLMLMLATWLIGQWVLMVFSNPRWIQGVGVAFGIILGWVLGGTESREGAEEFAFTLPPTRGQRYIVRMFVGLATVLFFVMAGVIAIHFNLPQRLWGLVVDSGFTQPFPENPQLHGWNILGAVVLPVLTFSIFFVETACWRTFPWAITIFNVVVKVQLVFLLFYAIKGNPPGLIVGVTSPIVCILVLFCGHFIYTRKEGIVPATFVPPAARWGLGIVVLIILLGVAIIALLMVSQRSVSQTLKPSPQITAPSKIPMRMPAPRPAVRIEKNR